MEEVSKLRFPSVLHRILYKSVLPSKKNKVPGQIFTTRNRRLEQGNVFRSVCQLFCSQGEGFSLWTETPWTETPLDRDPQAQTVPCLLECILVSAEFAVLQASMPQKVPFYCDFHCSKLFCKLCCLHTVLPMFQITTCHYEFVIATFNFLQLFHAFA